MEQQHERKTHIRWTSAEREKVLRRVLELGYIPGDRGLSAALRQAQECLPRDRRRNLSAISRKEHESAMRDLRIFNQEDFRKAQETKERTPSELLAEAIQRVIDSRVDEAIRAQEPSIMAMIERAVSERVAFMKTGGIALDRSSEVKAKVLIVGCLEKQHAHLRKALCDMNLNVQFFDKKGTVRDLKRVAAFVQHVIVWANYSAPPLLKAVKDHPGLIKVTGGISSVETAARSIAENLYEA